MPIERHHERSTLRRKQELLNSRADKVTVNNQGLAHRAKFLNEKGNLPEIEKPMLCDALATIVSACLGTTNHRHLHRISCRH